MGAWKFIVLVTGTLSVVGAGIGCALRRWRGQKTKVLLAVLTLALLPWLWHHLYLMANLQRHLLAASGDPQVASLTVITLGPALVALFAAITMVKRRALGRVVSAMPALAWVVTMFVTLPIARYAAPEFYVDNIAHIWLFIFSVASMIMVLAYSWPMRLKKH